MDNSKDMKYKIDFVFMYKDKKVSKEDAKMYLKEEIIESLKLAEKLTTRDNFERSVLFCLCSAAALFILVRGFTLINVRVAVLILICMLLLWVAYTFFSKREMNNIIMKIDDGESFLRILENYRERKAASPFTEACGDLVDKIESFIAFSELEGLKILNYKIRCATLYMQCENPLTGDVFDEVIVLNDFIENTMVEKSSLIWQDGCVIFKRKFVAE